MEVRDAEGAERCIASAVRAGADDHQLADMLFAATTDHRYIQEAHQPFLVSTPETYRPVQTMPDLDIVLLDSTSPWPDFSLFMTTQRQGFDPTYRGQTTRAEAERFRQMLGQGLALLARWDDIPVAVALVTEAHDGVCELTGIATLQPHRRRGFATTLTARALQLAFADQVEIACLTAEDDVASRLYQRVGFAPVATMLTYVAPKEFPTETGHRSHDRRTGPGVC